MRAAPAYRKPGPTHRLRGLEAPNSRELKLNSSRHDQFLIETRQPAG